MFFSISFIHAWIIIYFKINHDNKVKFINMLTTYFKIIMNHGRTDTMKKIFILLIIFLMMPIAAADESADISVADSPFLTAHLENCTIINQERINNANFTTGSNYTFPYINAKNITYEINGTVRDYMIVWKCPIGNYLDVLSCFHDLTRFYSDYVTSPINGVCYMEKSTDAEYIYGIILDSENISYTEGDLVHDVLGKYDYGLTSDPIIEIKGVASPADSYDSHYHGPVIDKYDLVRNDPYSYYDYFDYEDDMAIDDYMYDNGYDE